MTFEEIQRYILKLQYEEILDYDDNSLTGYTSKQLFRKTISSIKSDILVIKNDINNLQVRVASINYTGSEAQNSEMFLFDSQGVKTAFFNVNSGGNNFTIWYNQGSFLVTGSIDYPISTIKIGYIGTKYYLQINNYSNGTITLPYTNVSITAVGVYTEKGTITKNSSSQVIFSDLTTGRIVNVWIQSNDFFMMPTKAGSVYNFTISSNNLSLPVLSQSLSNLRGMYEVTCEPIYPTPSNYDIRIILSGTGNTRYSEYYFVNNGPLTNSDITYSEPYLIRLRFANRLVIRGILNISNYGYNIVFNGEHADIYDAANSSKAIWRFVGIYSEIKNIAGFYSSNYPSCLLSIRKIA